MNVNLLKYAMYLTFMLCCSSCGSCGELPGSTPSSKADSKAPVEVQSKSVLGAIEAEVAPAKPAILSPTQVVETLCKSTYEMKEVKFRLRKTNLFAVDGKLRAELPVFTDTLLGASETDDGFTVKYTISFACADEPKTVHFSRDEIIAYFETALAKQKMATGDAAGAIAAFAEALGRNPALEDVRFSLVRLLVEAGRLDEAAALLSIDPTGISIPYYFRIMTDQRLNPLRDHPVVAAVRAAERGDVSFTFSARGIAPFGVARSKEKGLLALISTYESWGADAHTDHLDLFDERTGARVIRTTLADFMFEEDDAPRGAASIRKAYGPELQATADILNDLGFRKVSDSEIRWVKAPEPMGGTVRFIKEKLGLVVTPLKVVILKEQKPIRAFENTYGFGYWQQVAYLPNLETIVAWTHVDEPEGCMTNAEIDVSAVLPLRAGTPLTVAENQNSPVHASDARPADRVITRFFAGEGHYCALRKNGQLLCYGNNDSGQLGDETSYYADLFIHARHEREGLGLVYPFNMTHVKEAALGESYTCALKNDGTVWCFGNNRYAGFYFLSPVKMEIPQAVVALRGGRNNVCALTENKDVWCFGAMPEYSMEKRNANYGRSFRQVRGLGSVIAINVGQYHTCAVRTDRTVRCWGYNKFGELGDGTTLDSATPVKVAGLTAVIDVSVEDNRTCALKQDGTVWCFGRENGYSRATGKDEGKAPLPERVGGVEDVVQIESGTKHTCAKRRDGTVWCWGAGRGYHDCPGLERCPAEGTPYPVPAFDSAVSLAGEEGNTCAVKPDGTVWCVGVNRYRRMVSKMKEYLETPAVVPGLR